MKAKRKKSKYSLKQYENPRDERQALQARKILNESLLIFAALVMINAWVWEHHIWSESIVSTTFVFAGVSFLYDRIKSIATNCLFGIRGAKFQLFPTIAGILTSLVGIYNPLRFGSGLEPFSVIRNGLVTWEFQMAISWILLLASLFITLFYIIHERKTKKRPDNSEEDD